MLNNVRSVRMGVYNLVGKPPLLARNPTKFSEEDWDFNNRVKIRLIDGNQRLAEQMMDESLRVVDQANDTTKDWQQEVNHHLNERVKEIRFLLDELNRQKTTAMKEEEALNVYRDRVVNAIELLKEKSLNINKQCLLLREGRLGVDLCNDEVDRQLLLELKIIQGCQMLMNKTLREATEQLRKLRATMYELDLDLEQKDKSLLIDENNLRLKDTNRDLGEGIDLGNLNCYSSLVEWQEVTYKNLQNNSKQLNTAGSLRAYIDLLLRQVCEDMRNQTERTNDAFKQRIYDLKEMKSRMEDKHHETMQHILDVKRNMVLLEKERADKSRAMTLCKVRLSNRAKRAGVEATCDTVQDSLYAEMEALHNTDCLFLKKIRKNEATLRYLLHTQMMQEEELNIKTNSIKIDEVDCMTLRETLSYQNF